MGKSITTSVAEKQFDSLQQQLSTERAKRREMERTIAKLMKVSNVVEKQLDNMD